MAATQIFTCTCGIQKQSTNHWILAIVTPASIRFVPWDSALALRDDVIVLCGERCAAALLSRSLGDWKTATAALTAPAASHSLSHSPAKSRIAQHGASAEPLTIWEDEPAFAAA